MQPAYYDYWCHQIFTPEKGDFLVNYNIFDIGGKNKTGRQLEGMPNSFILKDAIEQGFGNVIPLWLVGFLY